jgi:hypothetical protein
MGANRTESRRAYPLRLFFLIGPPLPLGYDGDMTCEEATHLLRYEAEEGAFMDARMGKDSGPERMAQLRIALMVLWRHYHTQPALPFSVASPAALIAFFWRDAVEAILKSGANYRGSLVSRELPNLGIAAFELLSGPDAAPVMTPGES